MLVELGVLDVTRLATGRQVEVVPAPPDRQLAAR